MLALHRICFTKDDASSDSTVGDSTEYIESAQRTVTSLGAISTDTQDSARYDDAPFPCGNIHFWSGQMNMEESSVCSIPEV